MKRGTPKQFFDVLIRKGCNVQELTIVPMNICNFNEAKAMMEKSFATTMKEFADNIEAGEGNEELPSIDGVLERSEETPVVFYLGERMVGGAVLIINDDNNNVLELLFISSDCIDRGIGYRAWLEIEKRYPQTRTWTTITPTDLTRNVNFYVNKCGFHIIRVDDPKSVEPMFVFQKTMQ